jgi:hypothetical protein
MFQPPYKNILSSDRTDIFSFPVSTYVTQPELHMIFSYGATANSATRFPHCPDFTVALRHITFSRNPLGD